MVDVKPEPDSGAAGAVPGRHRSRPLPGSEEDIGFKRQRMVPWFSPGELLRSGVKAGLATVLGSYTDRREILALAAAQAPADLSSGNELWLDYVSDVGEGFDSAYTMARLLAAPELRFAESDSPLPRGSVLLMGGDQVYPTPTPIGYRDRLSGPYRAALPQVEGTPPRLYAIPANHDWYDGLASFVKVFCQRRTIGAWETEQTRSYFALKLPHGWWLWAVDIRLDAYIDQPQMDYFREVAGTMPPGSPIIVMSAEPSWIYAGGGRPWAIRNLEFLEWNAARRFGHTIRVVLSGDLHHYSRYVEARTGRNYITAGGGGAHLHPTHHLAASLAWPRWPRDQAVESSSPSRQDPAARLDNSADAPAHSPAGPDKAPTTARAWRHVDLQQGGVFPRVKDSLRFRWGALRFILNNPSAGFMIGLIYFFLTAGTGRTVAGAPADILGSPLALLLLSGMGLGLCVWADFPGRWKIVAGLAHTLAHGAAMFGTAQLLSAFNGSVLGLDANGWLGGALYLIEMLVVGGIAGGLVLGLYLLIADFRGRHGGEVFASQRIPDFKNFLRLHIGRDGTLTIYPIGVRNCVRDWKFVPPANATTPWFEPGSGAFTPGQLTELIEPPIRLETRR